MIPFRLTACIFLTLLLALVVPYPISLPAGQPGLKTARVGADGESLPKGSFARLGTLCFRQGSKIVAVAIAPDGRTAASAGRDGIIRLWEVPTGRELRRFSVLPVEEMGLAFAPDGKGLAASNGNTKVLLWDVTNGRLLREYATAGGPIAFSHDGRSLAASSKGQFVGVWDVATGKKRLCSTNHRRQVVTVRFSSDDKAVLSVGGYEDRQIHFHETTTGKELRKPIAHQNNVHTFVLSPDGRTLAIAGCFPALQMREVASGKTIHTPVPGKTRCFSVAFTPDGRGLVSGEEDGIVRLWDVRSGKELRRFAGLREAVHGLAISADGKILIAGGAERVLRVWDMTTGTLLGPQLGHGHRVLALHFTADGKSLLSAARDGSVRTWDVAAGKEMQRQEGQATWRDACFSPDGKALACFCPAWGEVCLWDLSKAAVTRRLRGSLRDISPLAFTADGKRLLTQDTKRGAVLWEASIDKVLHRFDPPNMPLVNVACSPNGDLLASSHFSLHTRSVGSQPLDRIFLWSAATGKEVHEIAADLGVGHLPLSFAPDGRTLAYTARVGPVCLAETTTGRVRRVFRFRTPPRHPEWGNYTVDDHVAALAFSPDCRLLALGLEHKVYLWDALTGEQVGQFAGHEGKIATLAFAPDGKTLASAGDDTTILLWDLATVSGQRRVERKLEANTLGALWAELGRNGAADAMARLVAAPSQAVPLLADNLRPVPVRQADKVAKLLERLESARFRDREDAMGLLAGFAELIEPDLRKRLESKLTEEVRRRLQQLLDRLRPESAEQMRRLRAVEVLERIGTAKARAVLERLADGTAEARLTQEARASLRRLKRFSPRR